MSLPFQPSSAPGAASVLCEWGESPSGWIWWDSGRPGLPGQVVYEAMATTVLAAPLVYLCVRAHVRVTVENVCTIVGVGTPDSRTGLIFLVTNYLLGLN